VSFFLNTTVGKRESLYTLASLFSSLHVVIQNGKPVIIQRAASATHCVVSRTIRLMVCYTLHMYQKLLEVSKCNIYVDFEFHCGISRV
jgi:hypothetical protein